MSINGSDGPFDKFVDATRLVTVDYDKTLGKMVDEAQQDLGCNYPFASFRSCGDGIQQVALELIRFNGIFRNMKDAVREMEHHGLKPARVEHLLALAAQFPELQEQFLIVAPGSSGTVFYSRHALYLCMWHGKRAIRACSWYHPCWDSSKWHFLAMHEPAVVLTNLKY